VSFLLWAQFAGTRVNPFPTTSGFLAAKGTYTLSGRMAALQLSSVKVLSAFQGTYTVSGVATSLRKSRVLVAAVGGYSVSGKAAGIIYLPAGDTTAPSVPGAPIVEEV
jgi:hypothetical protein